MSFVLPFSVEPALDALREATAMAMARHGHADIEVKDDDTLVTDADRNIEKMLRNRLSVLAPDWSFLGEEGGLVAPPMRPAGSLTRLMARPTTRATFRCGAFRWAPSKMACQFLA